jgi:hypothetical protein
MTSASAPFDSAWLKWGWGEIEAEALKNDIDAFTEHLRTDGLGTTRCEYQPNYHRFAVILDSIHVVEFPQRWGLRLGNIVHNYRSALDHIAWTLVCQGKTPPPTLTDAQRRSVMFPLQVDRSKFNAGIQRQFPGVGRAELAKVRRYQPFNTRKRGGTAALAILERLSRFDKHRSIQPVAAYPFGGALEVTYTQDCELSRQTKNNPRGELKVDAEFAYVYVRKTGPKPEMAVKASLDVKPVIDEGFWLNEWMHNAKGMVAIVLGQFSEPPKKLIERLERPA